MNNLFEDDDLNSFIPGNIRPEKQDESKSGFFDLPKSDYCQHPQHDPPRHLHIPKGKGYKHICPRCGKQQTIIPQQITL